MIKYVMIIVINLKLIITVLHHFTMTWKNVTSAVASHKRFWASAPWSLCRQRNRLLTHVKSIEIISYLPISDRFGTKWNNVWCQINQKRLIKIKIWCHFTRFRERFINDLSLYLCLTTELRKMLYMLSV